MEDYEEYSSGNEVSYDCLLSSAHYLSSLFVRGGTVYARYAYPISRRHNRLSHDIDGPGDRRAFKSAVSTFTKAMKHHYIPLTRFIDCSNKIFWYG